MGGDSTVVQAQKSVKTGGVTGGKTAPAWMLNHPTMSRCENTSAVNAQLCADTWRNIPEGSGIGHGMWRALRVYWRFTHGHEPPPGLKEVILRWPEDQLRWLRATMVQYTSSEGIHLRIAEIVRVNSRGKGDDWELGIALQHTDRLVRVRVRYPWDQTTGQPLWP